MFLLFPRLQDVEKIYKFEDATPVHSRNTHVYLISSNLITFKRVLDQIQAVLATNSTAKYHVIIIPKVLNSFEILLEELGLYDIVTLHSYCWQMIQIDSGILSLEIPNLFTEVFVNRDLSLLPSLSYSLCTLFCVTGKPRVTVAVGKYPASVLNQIDTFTDHLDLPPKAESDFDAFILIDRSVDYISSLLTTATYAGLLTEIFRVNCGIVESISSDDSPQQKADNTQNPKPTYLFSLDSINDAVYADIKNRHISEVSDILGNQARQLKSEGQASKDMALSEIKTYVQTKLQKVTAKSRSLSGHLQACEKIIEKLGSKFEKLQITEQSFIENINKSTNIRNIEDLILTESEYMSLRLICLMSLTQRMSADEFHNFKVQYLQTHGYKYLYVFDNLINCGLVQEPVLTKLSALSLSLPNIGTKKDFYSVASKLKLVPQKPEQVNVRAPTCPSYVFGGSYIPLVAQLVTALVQAQHENDFKSKLDVLGGSLTSDGIAKPFPLQKRSILVCVIGGLTYAEVAACNLVEKLCTCKIVLCSNCMLSGNDLMAGCK